MVSSGLDSDAPAPQKHLLVDASTIARDAVNACVDAAVKETEKADIQSMINGLVSRVVAGEGEIVVEKQSQQEEKSCAVVNGKQKESAIADAIAAVKVAEARALETSSRAAKSSDGVRVDDHRVYRVRGGPLCWTQTADSVTVTVAVPSWVRKEHVIVRMQPGALSIRVGFVSSGDAEFEVTQPLFGGIDPDGSMWMLDGSGDGRKLTLELEKARVRWWPRLFMGDDPSEYCPVVECSANESGSTPAAPESPSSPKTNSPPPPSPTSNIICDEAPQPPDHPPPPLDAEAIDLSSGKVEKPVRVVVEEILGEVVEKVATDSSHPRRPGVFGAPQGVHRVNRSMGTARRGGRNVLTPADLARLLQQYKGTVESEGPGSPQAALQLATFYNHGIGMPQNLALAAKYYRYALENGAIDAGAAFQLGMIYNSGGEGISADAEQAVRWWHVAARLGNSLAMFNLGVMYMQGNGCDMDPVTAVQWFQRAHALNPELKPPAFTRAQLAERIAESQRRKIEKAKQQLSPEEREAQREAAMRDIRLLVCGTTGIAALGLGAMIVRYWWRNRL